MTAEGTLRVQFDSASGFLSSSLPIEVRDAGNRLVAQAAGYMDHPLPEGLYLVRATLPGGARHQEVVVIGAGETVERVLPSVEGQDPTDALAGLASADLWATSPGDGATAPSQVVETHGCTVEHDDGDRWAFVPGPDLRGTPFAVFALGGDRVAASLPVNPASGFPESACLAAAVATPAGDRVAVSFSRQRRVAATLQGLVAAGTVLTAPRVLEQASELLLGKYQDPPAAALGALTVHRLGRLQERPHWIENLARDFPWVPDGRVLLAALLSRSEDRAERDRGLQALLDASGQRLMFTDGLALLLELLRRWPDGDSAGRRDTALAAVALGMPGVDWDAVFLTTYDDAGAG